LYGDKAMVDQALYATIGLLIFFRIVVEITVKILVVRGSHQLILESRRSAKAQILGRRIL